MQDADGVELTHQQSSFTVSSSAVTGTGITATLVATPTDVTVGDSVALALTFKNQGNADISNLPVTVTIVRNQETTPAKVLNLTVATLAQNATVAQALNWVVAGKAGDTFSVTATTVFNGQSKTLASSAFTAKAAAVVVALSPLKTVYWRITAAAMTGTKVSCSGVSATTITAVLVIVPSNKLSPNPIAELTARLVGLFAAGMGAVLIGLGIGFNDKDRCKLGIEMISAGGAVFAGLPSMMDIIKNKFGENFALALGALVGISGTVSAANPSIPKPGDILDFLNKKVLDGLCDPLGN